MYNYGYNGWGWNNGWSNPVRGTDDQCSQCTDGRIGCGFSTYHNNVLLGGCKRPVLFTKLIRKCIDGKEIDVLVSDREFFDRLRFDCTQCREFYASICTCIEFGDTRPVFLADKAHCEDGCGRLIPLETSRNGYMIHADQIQPFADSMRVLKLTACFDPCNDHVTISNYYKKHAKCDCRCNDVRCGCDCDNFDGRVDGFRDGMVDGYADGMVDGIAGY